MKTVRVDEEVYDALLGIAHKSERQNGRRVSLGDAVAIALQREMEVSVISRNGQTVHVGRCLSCKWSVWDPTERKLRRMVAEHLCSI